MQLKLALLLVFSSCLLVNSTIYLDSTAAQQFDATPNYNDAINIFCSTPSARCRLSNTMHWDCSSFDFTPTSLKLSKFGIQVKDTTGIYKFLVMDAIPSNTTFQTGILEAVESATGNSADFDVSIEDFNCGLAFSYKDKLTNDQWYLTHGPNLEVLFQKTTTAALNASLHTYYFTDAQNVYKFAWGSVTGCNETGPVGSYWNNATSKYVDCAANKFSNASGLNACFQCDYYTDTANMMGSTNCSQCQFGTYYDSSYKKCSGKCPSGQSTNIRGASQYDCHQCPFACKTCDMSGGLASPGKCLTCFTNWVFDTTTQTCILDTTLQTSSTNCLDTQNCSICLDDSATTNITTNFTQCLQCNSEKTHMFVYATYPTCSECNTQCKTCSMSGNSNSYSGYYYDDCTSCYDGFFLDKVTYEHGKCSACPDSCSTCTAPDQCTTCGYYWNKYFNSADNTNTCVLNTTHYYPDDDRRIWYSQDGFDRSWDNTWHQFYTMAGQNNSMKCYLRANSTAMPNFFYWECDSLKFSDYKSNRLYLDKDIKLHAYLNDSMNIWLNLNTTANTSSAQCTYAPTDAVQQVEFDRFGCGYSMAVGSQGSTFYIAAPNATEISNLSNSSVIRFTSSADEKAQVFILGYNTYKQHYGGGDVCKTACPLGSFANTTNDTTFCQECDVYQVGRFVGQSKCDACPTFKSINTQPGNYRCLNDAPAGTGTFTDLTNLFNNLTNLANNITGNANSTLNNTVNSTLNQLGNLLNGLFSQCIPNNLTNTTCHSIILGALAISAFFAFVMGLFL